MCGRSISEGQAGLPALCQKCLRSLQVDLDRQAQIAREAVIKKIVGLLLIVLGIVPVSLIFALSVLYDPAFEDWIIPMMVLAYLSINLGWWLWKTVQADDRDQKYLAEYLWWRRNRL